MEKEYTEEDMRQAFYKGREQGKLPDPEGTVMFIRPTFNGYLREIEGGEDPHENWKKRVQGLIDDKEYWEKINKLQQQ